MVAVVWDGVAGIESQEEGLGPFLSLFRVGTVFFGGGRGNKCEAC